MDKKYLPEELISKYNKGTCTEEERAIVESWHLSDLKKDTLLPSVENILSASERMRGRVLSHARVSTKQISLWPRIAAAVAIIVVLFGAGLWYLGNSNKIEDSAQYVNDIAPGKNGATLTLANGKTIKLSDASNGKLAQEAGIAITKSADGQLEYEIKGSAGDPNKINTLSTAKGETYKVRLPDGSLVYLNSASSLTYPVSLIERGKRKVKLSGEGYFEIYKDTKHPFVVETDKQEVEVLGTQFNVMAYVEEPTTLTTLVEGKVRIATLAGKSMELLPGSQAMLSKDGLHVQKVNVEDYTVWKDGVIVMESQTLGQVFRQLERWYDIEFVVEKGVRLPVKTLSGDVLRDLPLSALLQTLEEQTGLRFERKERRVEVKGN